MSSKKQDLKIVKQVVGIDISMDKFYICYKVLYDNGHVSVKGTNNFDNDAKGMKLFPHMVW